MSQFMAMITWAKKKSKQIQLYRTKGTYCGYMGTIKIVIFYTEILTGKVVLWCFFSSETSEKIHNSTFQVKISV